jgi:Ca2+-binding EF-hand superfamily protein
MRKTTLFLLSGVIATSAFGFSASADRGHGMFERADANGDGFVTKEEFAASRDTMFQNIDANKDGNLTQEEMKAAREAWRAKMGKPAQDESQANADPAKQKKHEGFMKRLDTDQNGQVSAAEFNAAGERMFARLDDNGDGKIAMDEIPQRKKKTEQPTEQPAQ